MDYFAQSPISYDSPPRPWCTSKSSLSASPSKAIASPSSSSPPKPLPLPRRHRHSECVDKAMVLCQKLAAEATTSAVAGEDQGIIQNLESTGWTYHTTTEGVRIFSKQSTETSSINGVRENESLPYFRGEGWVEGSWQLEDLYATIVSVGSRSVWDSKLDANDSYVAAYLSETDQLWKSHIRAELGVNREAALVSSYALDPLSPNTAYAISASVEDPLLIQTCGRGHVHLNGVCIRRLLRQPHFEQPPRSNEPPPSPLPNRPGHRRTKSSAIIPGSGGGLLSPGLAGPISMPLATSDGLQPRMPFFGSSLAPPPSLPPLIHRSNSLGSLSNNTDSENRLLMPIRTDLPLPPTETTPVTGRSYDGLLSKLASPNGFGPPSAVVTNDDRPGVHISLILHVAPGLNLPQTTVNQLSLHLPLSIHAIGRYVLAHGFVPHLIRTPGIEVMEEAFDFPSTTYRAVFRRSNNRSSSDRGRLNDEQPTRIRFFGSTFAKGRFDIEVSSPSSDYDPTWSIEYDVSPIIAPEIRRFSADEDAHARPRVAGPRKSSLSILGSPTLPLAAGSTRYPHTNSPTSKEEKDGKDGAKLAEQDWIDPALLPGPLGACTLILPPPPPYVPITISITKNLSLVSKPIGTTLSTALGQAAKSDADLGWDSIEHMLAATVVGSEAWAERNLTKAKKVLDVVKEGKKEEEQSGGLERIDEKDRGGGKVLSVRRRSSRAIVSGRKGSSSFDRSKLGLGLDFAQSAFVN
ncbi:BQ2448_1086 [Microbotryum intermedium]|uniref:BQ2448_1086 protein n=1 Tax=Microbotryum intermedium TaxID=269621 RepID=A0A238F755_9BASI|nr:BQ2448_1086 [Microbotryum intermedium]